MTRSQDNQNHEAQITACRLLKGSVIHAAVETTMTNPHSGVRFKSYKPVCGRRAPKRSLTYGYMGTREAVTCAACLARQKEKESERAPLSEDTRALAEDSFARIDRSIEARDAFDRR